MNEFKRVKFRAWRNIGFGFGVVPSYFTVTLQMDIAFWTLDVIIQKGRIA